MTSLSAVSLDLTDTIFSKTAAGLQEVQTRAMGLPALIRRVLVLVDGKRSGKELAAFVGGEENISEVLGQLIAQGCIDVQKSAPAPATAKTAAPAAAPKAAAPKAAAPAAAKAQPDDAALLAKLPHAALRTAKETEMARHFMINTVNTMFGQNMRLTLIQAVFDARNAEELRQVYPAWASTMSGSSIGAKRLPELRDKLFQVL